MATYNINDFNNTGEYRPPKKGEFYYVWSTRSLKQATIDFNPWNSRRIYTPKDFVETESRDIVVAFKIKDCVLNENTIRQRINEHFGTYQAYVIKDKSLNRVLKALEAIGELPTDIAEIHGDSGEPLPF